MELRMAQKLTDKIVKDLAPPVKGNKIAYDTEAGFGARITAAGARAFVLNYRTRSGRERRFTIGTYPAWKVTAAREEARRLKKLIYEGQDPLAELKAERDAPTVGDLCRRYEEEHLPKKRQGSQLEDQSLIATRILPELQHLKVAEVSFSDIDALHRKITQEGKPIRANRAIALLSKMFSLAIKWKMRSDTPVRGVERNQEHKRTRYLSGAELARLTEALAAYPDQQAANIVRMLLFTGARRGEVLAAKWDDFDLETGTWTKPGATTKQKTEHRVPLSAPARKLLADLTHEGAFVFPGRHGGHRENVKRAWAELSEAACIKEARLHDLRHTYASLLASSGMSLPIIGALLGHTQAATTQRYAHLLDDPLRAATETAGAIITGKPSAEVISIKGATFSP
jgi:integrase